MFKLIDTLSTKERLKLCRIISFATIGFTIGYVIGSIPVSNIRNIVYVFFLAILFIPQAYILYKEDKRFKKQLEDWEREKEELKKKVE